MNTKNKKTAIDDKSLEFVTGGTEAPTLPAKELKGSEYSTMFSNSQGLEPKEFHIYKNGIADPTSFKVGFFPGLSGFP